MGTDVVSPADNNGIGLSYALFDAFLLIEICFK